MPTDFETRAVRSALHRVANTLAENDVKTWGRDYQSHVTTSPGHGSTSRAPRWAASVAATVAAAAVAMGVILLATNVDISGRDPGVDQPIANSANELICPVGADTVRGTPSTLDLPGRGLAQTFAAPNGVGEPLLGPNESLSVIEEQTTQAIVLVHRADASVRAQLVVVRADAKTWVLDSATYCDGEALQGLADR